MQMKLPVGFTLRNLRLHRNNYNNMTHQKVVDYLLTGIAEINNVVCNLSREQKELNCIGATLSYLSFAGWNVLS